VEQTLAAVRSITVLFDRIALNILRTTPMKLVEVHQADFGTGRLPEPEAGPNFPLIIATMPATARQRAIAFGIIILLTVAAAAIAPFARIQLPQVNAFIPVCRPS
jgi:hypothetical protein